MQTIETSAPARIGRWRTSAAALLAAALVVGAAAPASAAVFADWTRATSVDAPRSGFHHHFYRGVPGQNRAAPADVSAVAADAGAQEEAAVAYCADRFKSYDPASGTYLGYDGYEHACP